jgi:hypothetical protein
VAGVLRGGGTRTVAPLLTGSVRLRTQARPPLSMSPARPAKAGPAPMVASSAARLRTLARLGPSTSPARLPTLRVAGVLRGGRPRPTAPRPPRRRPAGLAPMAARLGTLTRLPLLTSPARPRTVSPTLPVAGVPRGGRTRTVAPLPTGSAQLRTQARPPLSMSPARPAARLRTLARPRPASLTLPVAGVLRGVRPRTVAP